jgi:hypothetical protein
MLLSKHQLYKIIKIFQASPQQPFEESPCCIINAKNDMHISPGRLDGGPRFYFFSIPLSQYIEAG